jgi:mitochondrial fission protein ELM1
MIRRFPCPYLNGEVDLTEERERHIAERHPDLLPEHRPCIAETLGAPDQVRASVRFGSAKLFSRWYTEVRQGKYVVVVVVSERTPQERHWIITAYLASKLAHGGVEWQRA